MFYVISSKLFVVESLNQTAGRHSSKKMIVLNNSDLLYCSPHRTFKCCQ